MNANQIINYHRCLQITQKNSALLDVQIPSSNKTAATKNRSGLLENNLKYICGELESN